MNEKNPEADSYVVRAILSTGASRSQLPDRGVVTPDAAQRNLQVFFSKQGDGLYR